MAITITIARIAAALTLGAGMVTGVFAQNIVQNYPAKPVRVVLPFPAGTGADAVTRTVTQKLSEALGAAGGDR